MQPIFIKSTDNGLIHWQNIVELSIVTRENGPYAVIADTTGVRTQYVNETLFVTGEWYTLYEGSHYGCQYYLKEALRQAAAIAKGVQEDAVIDIRVPTSVSQSHTHQLKVFNTFGKEVYETSFAEALDPFPDPHINTLLDEALSLQPEDFYEWQDKLTTGGQYYRTKRAKDNSHVVNIYPIIYDFDSNRLGVKTHIPREQEGEVIKLEESEADEERDNREGDTDA